MAVDFQLWGESIRRLDEALGRLVAEAASVNVAPPEGQEWFELLRHKLLPQVSGAPWLVAAVVGGTNIGKSVVFNHLAGVRASGVSPIASKTRHPVCLVPPGFADDPALRRIFAGFELRPWQSDQDAWTECDEHLLFWTVGQGMPDRLLALDTPDIDSDAPVNWQRADRVRQTADVLLAVLTQQKYNDAAVKQFFRKAAEADKPVIVVFNQCDLVEDRPYWPQWLATFVGETQADVQLVYVVPYDRQAAGALALPFYEVGRDGLGEPRVGASLREELSSLHFDAIKIRTLRGALERVIDTHAGAPRYVDEVRRASQEFAAAARLLESEQLARPDWPALPPQTLVDEMRSWWDQHRGVWTRRVHGAYRVLGEGVLWPMRKAWRYWAGEPVDPLVAFAKLERQAIIGAVEAMFHELTRLAEMGNEILKPRLAPLVGGEVRARFLATVVAEHARLPAIDDEFRGYVRQRLDRFAVEHPSYRELLRWVDQSMALLRPVITFTFSLGLPIEHVLHQAAAQVVTDTVTQVTLSQVAVDTAIHGGTTIAGDALATVSASEGIKLVAGLFRDLQRGFCDRRRQWLEKLVDDHLLGEVRRSLQQGAAIARGENLGQVVAAVEQLDRLR